MICRRLCGSILEVAKKNDLQTPQYDLTTEVLAQKQQINNLEETVTDHPAHRFGDSEIKEI